FELRYSTTSRKRLPVAGVTKTQPRVHKKKLSAQDAAKNPSLLAGRFANPPPSWDLLSRPGLRRDGPSRAVRTLSLLFPPVSITRRPEQRTYAQKEGRHMDGRGQLLAANTSRGGGKEKRTVYVLGLSATVNIWHTHARCFWAGPKAEDNT
ncbi:unnamed protein product, partial [Ectocarpus sp. 12 AP-2014]